ncbi:MAG: DNA repair protein RecN, partial [Verrucomicrobia bacterium]|nr:DNA repair protein RecN [Verrucomicrobiota bacterium]
LLVVKRVFAGNGSNRQFVNGSPTTLNILAALGQGLVDIHGPHDHQSLLDPARQLAILDAFGDLDQARGEFAVLLRRRTALEREKTALVVDEKTYAQQLDLLRHQVREIADAKLHPDEETQLEPDYRRASNAAKLLELGQTALGLLSENEDALTLRVGALGRMLQELQRLDPEARCVLSLHEQAVAALHDLQSDLSHYLDRIDLDPGRLQALEERLNVIQSLKRKYGGTLAEVLEFGDTARRQLAQLEQRDAELERINAGLRGLDAELSRAGAALSDRRHQLLPQLAKAANPQLADLGFKQSRFNVALETDAASLSRPAFLSPSGLDRVEFQFAPNPGEPAKPLRAIASSGELARVMLALKTVLAAEDEVPVLIFDEVDANVGGETAHAVGEKMRQLGRQRQVLCVTHLAPVAARATAHYVVTKQVAGGRTTTDIRLLSGKERVRELARMLGGQTDAALRLAETLLRADSQAQNPGT